MVTRQHIFYKYFAKCAIITNNVKSINGKFSFVIIGSYYDNCLAKNGEVYKKENGEFGCLYFHTLSSFFSPKRGKIYDYEKSKEFCENMGGSLPIIKDRNEDNAMLKMLGGYVSIFTWLS